MIKKFFSFFIITLIGSISIIAQSTYVQVVSDPGISVYINGEFKGKTSSDVGELIFEIQSGGEYTIKVIKDGYVPHEDKISIKTGDVFKYTVEPFASEFKIRQEGNEANQEIEQKTGNLLIQSLPVDIRISISQLGINATKSVDKWYVDDLPVGTYNVIFKHEKKEYSCAILIKEGELSHFFVNMINGEFENRSVKESISLELGNTDTNRKVKKISTSYGGIGNRTPRGSLYSPNISKCDVTQNLNVLVEINIDRDGNVITAFVSSATYVDNCIWTMVVEAAYRSRFIASQCSAYRETGWIEYTIGP